MNKGFLRVASAVSKVNVAEVKYNVANIISMCDELNEKKVQVAVFPEMSVTGYSCGDLFHTETLLQGAQDGLKEIVKASAQWPMLLFVGAPIKHNNRLYNCAVAIYKGEIMGVVPKSYIPENKGVNEKRWWQSGQGVNAVIDIAGFSAPLAVNQLFKIGNVSVGVEVGEDLLSPIPQSVKATMAGAQVVVNMSATCSVAGSYTRLKAMTTQQSLQSVSAYVYSGAGYGESTTDSVYEGNAFIAENGVLLAESERWSFDAKTIIADIDIDAINKDRLANNIFSDCALRELSEQYSIVTVDNSLRAIDEAFYRNINSNPFIPQKEADVELLCNEVVNTQVAGLARRIEFTHARSIVVGISGGLDSTLALLVAVKTFDKLGLDRTGIIGVTMPGFGTTDRTYNNALMLMSSLGISQREISIVPSVEQHFKDINHDKNVHDVTYENSQARERTQILMDVANQVGGMVLGTGDLSELALGWATYNGDHMSMYGVNAGVPKTLVKHLVRWIALQSEATVQAILLDIVDTPISPELIPADEDGNIKQKTENLVGPYELHDFVLYYTLRYGYSPQKIFYLAQKAFDGVYERDVIKHWMTTFFRRFFNQQFKRSCLPDGPNVLGLSISPRGAWMMPSDASSALWLAECAEL